MHGDCNFVESFKLHNWDSNPIGMHGDYNREELESVATDSNPIGMHGDCN